MTWTYDSNLDAPLNEVRFLIGDTDVTHQLMADEELNYLISSSSSTLMAAASACRALAAKFARRVHEEVGDLRLAANQMYEHYRQMAIDLSAQGASLAVPSAGGVYTAEKEAYAADTTVVQPVFSRGMHDFE